MGPVETELRRACERICPKIYKRKTAKSQLGWILAMESTRLSDAAYGVLYGSGHDWSEAIEAAAELGL